MIRDNFFSKNFFENWLDQAGPEISDWFAKETDFLKTNIKPDFAVLDVGCGFGRHMAILAPISKMVYGIDNDQVMADKAQAYLRGMGNVIVFLRDAADTGFEDDSFDYVICVNNTFGNFLDKKSAILGEMKRVCKRGGKIIVSVYSEEALGARKKDYEKVGLHITKIAGGTIFTKEGLISEQFFASQLADIFKEAGLTAKINKLTPISYICIARK